MTTLTEIEKKRNIVETQITSKLEEKLEEQKNIIAEGMMTDEKGSCGRQINCIIQVQKGC